MRAKRKPFTTQNASQWVHGSGSMDHAIANDSFAAKRESFASYERAQERAVAYTVLAKRGTLAQYAVPSKVQ